MFVKAFLSHSSKDKEIVGEVATLLSRANCVYDVFSFETGEEFSESIKKGLNESKIFVLFVGKDTLERPYVQEEISQAEKLYKKSQLKKCFAFILEPTVDTDRLPTWLKRIKYEKSDDPHHMVRVIKKMLDDINKSPRPFIGRDHDAESFEEKFNDEEKAKNIYFITGITGIGRKTFTKKMLQDKLSLQFSSCIEVKSGDGALEMALKVMDALGEKCDYQDIYRHYNAKSRLERIEFLLTKLAGYLERGECIIFCDEGGILHTDGTLDEEMREILDAISARQHLPVFFNTTMRPPVHLKFRQQHLKELSQSSSRLLLKRLLPKVEFESDNMDRIINRAAGYPPAIFYAAELAAKFGAQADFLDKIKNSTHNILSQYVSSLNIEDPDEISLLALLCRYTPVPYTLIEKYLGRSSEQTFSLVEKFINASILEVNESNLYEISKPLEYTISKHVEGALDDVDHLAVRDILSKLLENVDDIDGRLLFMRQHTRARMFLKEKYNNVDMFTFVSDIQKMAENAYNKRDYKEAIVYSRIVIGERKKMIEAHEILIKSLVHEEQFSAAQKCINEYRIFAQPKSIHFLEGFLKRYNNDFEGAIKSYKRAEENGYTSATIYRELAQCYILLGNNEEALKYAEIAYEKQENNIFIMDIYANALARNRRINAAKSIIQRMMSLSKSDFVFQRAAIFELSYGNPKSALELIYEALKVCKNPTFEMMAQKVIIACACNEAKIASETYDDMVANYPNKRKAMQDAARMSVYFIEGDHESAMMIYNQIKESKLVFVERVIKYVKDKYKL